MMKRSGCCLMRMNSYRLSSLGLYTKSQAPPPTNSNFISNSTKPQIIQPLFLRPPSYTATVSDLRKWKKWAKDLTLSVGSSFEASDNGPDATLLCREINWLLEDVVEDKSAIDIALLMDYNHSYDISIGTTVKVRTCVAELYRLWKQRIEERRPFQYIVGCEHWRDLVLCVQDGVLIPRPETELIVDLVAGVIRDNEDLVDGLWADLGTGSGALAIGIGKILGTKGRVVATDLSPVAAAVASFNVQRYGLQDKIEVRQGSWFEPLKDLQQKLAGLVSNPPYIPSDNIPGLQAEVGRHEPRLALDGGADGLDDLVELCNGAASMLEHGGYFVFETNGEKQCQLLANHLENNFAGCFSNVKIVSDSEKIPRFISGFRCSTN